MIVTDKTKITKKCVACKTIKEGEKIAVKLIDELKESKSGIGLAANQIGINKRVCVVNVKKPLLLINPEIIEHSTDAFAFVEGCLSFPKKAVRTLRFKTIKVKSDNLKKPKTLKEPENKDKDEYLLV